MGSHLGILQDIAGLRKDRKRLRAFAREWHTRNSVARPSDEPLVFFVIPLISRARAADWEQVVRNLSGTISSLRSQTNSAWRAVICSQDRPASITFDDQVRFLEYPTPAKPREGKNLNLDKAPKKELATQWIAETYVGDGYLFMLDADDILHPRLVDHVIKDNNGTGYLIDNGYMYDVAHGAIAPLRPGPLGSLGGKRPFYLECGSCAALYFDFRRDKASLEILAQGGRHKYLKSYMRDLGFPLSPVPFPAALYAINHGENLRKARGKLGSKLQYLDRHKLDPARSSEILQIFALPHTPRSKARGRLPGARENP